MIKHVEIINKQGYTLRGYLTMPDNCNGKLVIMYHGFTGNKTEHGGLFRDLSRLLETNKIASLRMDITGNGESDGTFKDFTFDILLSDAKEILDFGKQVKGIKEIILLGYSMGGAVTGIIARQNMNDVNSLILWSPAGNIIDLIRGYYNKYPKLDNKNADMPNFEISYSMYNSLDKYDVYKDIESYTKRVLIVHGVADLAVNISFGIKYKNTFPNATIEMIENCGHGYDKKEEKALLFKKTLDFLAI